MYAIVVTFGRNVGTTPMSDTRWAEFIEDVRGTLRQNTFERQRVQLNTTEGMGEWDGIPEPNAQVTVLLRSQVSEEAQATLKRDLSELARFYEQEAIAVMFATPELC